MLQARRFWCQGPAWQWKRENFQRFRIWGITCWRLVQNVRRIDRIIVSDSTSHFETPQSHGCHSEARKLGSVRVEAERRRFFSMSTVGPLLQNRWTPTWKRWNGRSYPAHHNLQTLLLSTPVSIDGTQPGSSSFPLLRRSQKMDRFMDRLKRRIVFSRWYQTIAGKLVKSSG